jgi:hypothetical protein
MFLAATAQVREDFRRRNCAVAFDTSLAGLDEFFHFARTEISHGLLLFQRRQCGVYKFIR